MRVYYKQSVYTDPPPPYTPYPTHDNQIAVTVNSAYPYPNGASQFQPQLQSQATIISPPAGKKKIQLFEFNVQKTKTKNTI